MTRTLPWVTGVIALLAFASVAVPAIGAVLIYDRAAILEGQIWRLWTGHLVHFTPAHLLWNLALCGFVGGWLERLAPAGTRCFYALAPVFISGVLLLLEPSLLRYAGLSGLGAGLTVLLAVHQGRLPTESRVIWTAVLGLVVLKVAFEWWTDAPLIAADIRPVPLAHGAGIIGAGLALLAWPRISARRRDKNRA